MSEEFCELLWCTVTGEQFADSGESAEHGNEGNGGKDHANESEPPGCLFCVKEVMELREQRGLFGEGRHRGAPVSIGVGVLGRGIWVSCQQRQPGGLRCY